MSRYNHNAEISGPQEERPGNATRNAGSADRRRAFFGGRTGIATKVGGVVSSFSGLARTAPRSGCRFPELQTWEPFAPRPGESPEEYNWRYSEGLRTTVQARIAAARDADVAEPEQATAQHFDRLLDNARSQYAGMLARPDLRDRQSVDVVRAQAVYRHGLKLAIVADAQLAGWQEGRPLTHEEVDECYDRRVLGDVVSHDEDGNPIRARSEEERLSEAVGLARQSLGVS